MSDSQREFAKALSLVTRHEERVAAVPSPGPRISGGRSSWPTLPIDHHFPSSASLSAGGVSPPNSEDMSVYDEEFLSAGFADEAITDRLGRLRHLQRMSRKGKRQPNWSETENNILVEQFEKYKDTLKPKRSEGVSARDKKEAWESICAAVNSSNAAALKRSAKDVRKKWENIRTWARKVVTEWKHDCNQTGNTECPPPDPPELARRIMNIYDGDEDHDFDDDFTSFDTSTNHADVSNHVTSRQTPPARETNNKNEGSPEDDGIKQEIGVAATRSASITPPPTSLPRSTVHIMGHSAASPLNVPRRYHRDGLLDYRLLDAARMEERLQQHNFLSGFDGNGSSLAPSTSPSPPPPKKPRRQRNEDDTKDLRELQRDVLILQKEKLVMEKKSFRWRKIN
ncbi:uncharacterized protein [Amphiura filiformis]|uniref:uncharacterized protein n=1 Tax=Amphiura filiformis TaxID=82378 RepID=UPI003B224CF9